LVPVTILLIRHGKAGSRREWDGDDLLRPLSRPGVAQAHGLVAVLRPYGVRRVLSSPFTRCRQTVEPLAEDAGVEVEPAEELAEGRSGKAIALVASLAGGPPVALCTHGDIVPEVLQWLVQEENAELESAGGWAKGSTWVLDDRDGRIVRARYTPPPRI
jgi:8-oxo-dGTP diphosphatase